MFVLDSSGSIGSPNFELIRSFVNTFVSTLEIGPTRSQIGVIVFSTGANIEFSLDTYSNRTSLASAVNSIQYSGGLTNTADALHLLINQGFDGARPESEGVPRVAIVITDGQSSNGTATKAAAEVLSQNSLISVIAVGIGNADISELNAIANTRDGRGLVRSISGFDETEIERLQEDLNDQTCTGTYN